MFLVVHSACTKHMEGAGGKLHKDQYGHGDSTASVVQYHMWDKRKVGERIVAHCVVPAIDADGVRIHNLASALYHLHASLRHQHYLRHSSTHIVNTGNWVALNG